MPAFPTDRAAFWWTLERENGPDSAFGPFDTAEDAEIFANNDPIADDQAAADSLGDRTARASVDKLAAEGVTDIWIVADIASEVDRLEQLIADGILSSGARGMSLADAIDQHNAANCLDPSDSDYIHPPAATISLADAVEIIPEAWHDEIAADAASQGCSVSYTAATSGLRTATIVNIQRTFAERAGDPDWEALSEGQQLDEVFPHYRSIGWPDLLGELGLVTVYHLRDR